MASPGALLAEGREAEVFAWGDGTVLRLLRDPADRPRMERSIAAMRAARASGVPTPGVRETVVVDGRPGIVMDRVDGPDLLAVLGKKPWKLVGIARSLGTIQARLHETIAPDELAPLREVARQRIADAPALPRELSAFALRQLDAMPDGDRICHGDYHPGNVLIGRDGPVVIDWTNASRGDPTADLARSRLMIRLGELPPGTPTLLRRLDRFGRNAFVQLYARSYAATRPFDEALARRWEPVRAAERMWDGIEEEYPALLGYLRERAGAET